MMWQLLSEPFGRRLSATLLHFVWQGAVIAAAAAILLRLLRSAAPHVRYAVAYGALVAMAAAPTATWLFVRIPAPRTADVVAAAPLAAAQPVRHSIDRQVAPTIVAQSQRPSSQPLPLLAAAPQAAPAIQPSLAATPAFAVVPRSLFDRALARIAPLQPYLLGAWLAGVALCASRLLAGIGGVWWLRGARKAVPVWLQVSVVRLGRRMGMSASGRVFASPRVNEAVAVGFWRPIVLVPMSWLTELPADIVEAIVAHELAHIRRFDLWAVFGQRLVETVLFYHPAVWWISRRISTEREMCCDAVAVDATGRRSTYVRALETVGRRAAGRPQLSGSRNASFAFATSFRGEEDMVLLKRVRQVLGIRAQSEAGRAWPAGALVAGLALGAWAFGAGFAGSQADADAPREGDRPKAEAGREGADRPAAEGARREGGDRPAAEGARREGGDRPAAEGARREGGDRPAAEGARREGGDRPAAEGSRREGAAREGGDREGAAREGAREGERPAARGEEPTRRNSELGGPGDFKPQTDREEALVKMIIGLRAELAALRREVEQSRAGGVRRDGDRPAAREGDRPAARDGERPAAGPRDGERPAGGAREGERPAARRDGERPAGAPRDGEKPRTGTRDGEGAPRTGPRDGERPAGGTREGDRPAAREGDVPAKTAPRGEG